MRVLVAVLATLCLYPPASASEQAPVETIEIVARPITQFHIGHDEKRFGPLEFVGGLEMTARSRNFGGLSAIRFLKPGTEFIGVADTGFWFFGTVAHGGDGRPSGIRNFTMQQMVDAAGRPIDKKRDADAESLAVKDGIATVGFEHNHRIAQFRIDPADMASPLRKLDFLIPARELRQNKGFETIAAANEGGPLKGSLVAVSERSLDTAGNVYAAILEGPGKGVFTVRRDGDFDITDGAFLPNGDLLLLERSFSIMGGDQSPSRACWSMRAISSSRSRSRGSVGTLPARRCASACRCCSSALTNAAAPGHFASAAASSGSSSAAQALPTRPSIAISAIARRITVLLQAPETTTPR